MGQRLYFDGAIAGLAQAATVGVNGVLDSCLVTRRFISQAAFGQL